jgi:glucose-6-phosphate isomerase
MSPVTLSFANALAPRLGPGLGLDPSRLAPEGDLSRRFQEALVELGRRRKGGELGFLRLPSEVEMARQVREVADSFGQWFETLVVVGIGGSSLGARAVAEALLGPHWNELSDEERDHFPRLYFMENADPDSTAAILDRVDPRRTLFNVVSKSGGTAETMAQYLIVEEQLRDRLGEEGARGHLLFTTDPERGVLRKLAVERGVPALAVPPDVGGRFSVLSPVGLLPAAVTGVDIDSLLEGARVMSERCLEPDLRRNPAGVLATLLHAADTEMGQPIHVFMPYADRLRFLALWFQQLWAESLGKRRPGGEGIEDDPALSAEGAPDGGKGGVGPTPLPALGAVDQHSLLQLLMEGPRDKFVVFLRVTQRARALPIPESHGHLPAIAYLGGHTLEDLLDTELRATTEALRQAGRPSVTLQVDRVDEEALGGLFMLCQVATVLAGAMYGVDPLDQPGVELGKRITSGLLGREGFERPRIEPDPEEWKV